MYFPMPDSGRLQPLSGYAPKRTFTDRLLKFKVVVQLNVAIAIVIWTVDVQIELDSA